MQRAVCMLLWGGLVASCGRSGYAPDGNTFVFHADTSDAAFADTDMSAVTVTDAGARLETRDGFALQPVVLPAAMAGGAAVGIDDGILVGGGSASYPNYSSCGTNVLRYTLGDTRLSLDAQLPVPNQGLRLERAANGDVYSIMGYCGTANTDEQTVHRLVDGEVTLVGSFVAGVYNFASAMVPNNRGDEVILTVGGYGSGPLRDTMQTLNPATGEAEVLAMSLPSARCMLAGAAYGNRMYVFGGNTETDCALPAAPAASPLTDEIIKAMLEPEFTSVVTHLPEPLAAACAIGRADGSILIFGGVRYREDGGVLTREVSDTIYRFDATTGMIETLSATLSAPRAAMACAESNGRIILAGGVDATFSATNDIQIFEPYADLGTITSPVLDSRALMTRWEHVFIDAEAPVGADLSVEVRVATDLKALNSAAWLDIGTDSVLPDDLGPGRYFQWRTTLLSESGSTTPVIHSVSVNFGP